jgi:hypothetical protein
MNGRRLGPGGIPLIDGRAKEVSAVDIQELPADFVNASVGPLGVHLIAFSAATLTSDGSVQVAGRPIFMVRLPISQARKLAEALPKMLAEYDAKLEAAKTVEQQPQA